ncbi:MAG: hypothetical protein RMJ37_01510 [Spirochaetia bacterium]|nr:hypothetical protein [Spirochaetota bacterium]MCX8097361.1 hypothetical protein [Spirochaetota bacterium]MDW8112000.1 hypothetical protein [Spirochaetia bacterium]
MEILEHTKLTPVGSVNGFDFLNSLNQYSTIIKKDSKIIDSINNFYCRSVSKTESKVILSGFYVNQNFYRSAGVLFLDKNLDIVSEKAVYDTFSEFVWSDGYVAVGNFYKPSDDVMNGDVFIINTLERLKLPVMLMGEYEFRGGIRYDNKYFFYGVDKDNYRGILVRFENELELLEININNDLWEFSGIEAYEGRIVLGVNMWQKFGFNGFLMTLEKGDYETIQIPVRSSWFEVVDVKKVDEDMLVSVFDFDENVGVLLEFDGGFKVIDKVFNSQYILSSDKVFVKNL